MIPIDPDEYVIQFDGRNYLEASDDLRINVFSCEIEHFRTSEIEFARLFQSIDDAKEFASRTINENYRIMNFEDAQKEEEDAATKTNLDNVFFTPSQL